MMLMQPRVGDVWVSPISAQMYFVVDIKKGYALAIILGKDVPELETFHSMDGPIPSSWTRVITGEEM